MEDTELNANMKVFKIQVVLMNRDKPNNTALVVGGSSYPDCGSPKLYTDPLLNFSRDPFDY